MVHILNPLLLIKVPLKVAYKPSDWLSATFRGTFIGKRGFKIWTHDYRAIELRSHSGRIQRTQQLGNITRFSDVIRR